jgi:hypothetical protein
MEQKPSERLRIAFQQTRDDVEGAQVTGRLIHEILDELWEKIRYVSVEDNLKYCKQCLAPWELHHLDETKILRHPVQTI